MKNRLNLHTVTLIHKILTEKKTNYLHRKIQYRTDIHNINVRRKNYISCPKHKLHIFKCSFSYNAYKLYNPVPSNLKNLTTNKFKTVYKNILFLSQT